MKQSISKNPVVGRRRRAVKQELIIETLRQEITQGKFRSGGSLPKQLELARRFKVSVVTIQRAMDRLAHEGFIETRYSRGTFVVDHPPHLNHYALIFHHDPSDLEQGGWSHFYAALVNEATKIQQREGRQFECFYGINGRVDTSSYHRLFAKARAHQFAGLIYTDQPGHLMETSLMKLEGVPRVAIMGAQSLSQTIPSVSFNQVAVFERAFDYLVSQGRKRVAFVSMASPNLPLESCCPPALLSARGLITRPYWNLPLPLWSPTAQHIVYLLMRSEGERPDALVITDDNLVEPAVAGLMAAGVRVPQDLEVVAHANFPRSGPRLLPSKWLGYDTHAILQTCLSIIDQQCRGEKPPVVTTIAPVFEEELANRKTAKELSPARPI